MLPPLAGLPSYTALADPMPAFLDMARKFKACVAYRTQDGTTVCCVCSRKLPLLTKDKGATLPSAMAAAADPSKKPWLEVPPGDIPNKLLLVTREFLPEGSGPTAPMPREGLTRYIIGGTTYCLDPDGITASPAGDAVAKVCPECWDALSPPKGSSRSPQVPMASLVRVDTGPTPEGLLPLTNVEAKLLAPLRASHDMYLLKPDGRMDRAPDAYQKKWVGHVIALPQPSGKVLQSVFPANPDDAVEDLSVVFLSAAAADSDIADMVAKSPSLQVRGPVIAKWARHMATVWADKPYSEVVSLSQANLVVYDTLTGVPHSILATAAAAADAQEAMELQQMLAADRAGYASTRTGSVEEAAAAQAPDSSTEPIGSMTGLVEFEVQIASASATEQSRQLQAAAQGTPSAEAVLAKGGKLVSCTGPASKDFGDYSVYWPLLVHPECFPHGVGHKPEGMSFQYWVKLLLLRKGFAENVPFMLHMFDVQQRHDTNIQTHCSLRSRGDTMEAAGAATVADVSFVLEVLRAGGRGSISQRFQETATPAAKALLRAFRGSGMRIPGSPQSFAALRSAMGGLWSTFGLFSSFVTLNPSALNSPAFFAMVGHA